MPKILTGIIVRLPCAACGVTGPTHVRPDGSTRCLGCDSVKETKG